MIFFFLCLISVVEVFSASSKLTYHSSIWGPILKHTGILIFGVVLTILVMNIKVRYYKLATPFLLIISFLTLVWVLFAGQVTNGAQRWVSLFGFQFQPSELAKGTIVLAVAQILSAMQGENGADPKAVKYILYICSVIVGLIMFENLSTALLICVVVYLMMFIGRVPKRLMIRIFALAMGVIVAFFAFVWLVGDVNLTKDGEPVKPKVEYLTDENGKIILDANGNKKVKPKTTVEKIFHRADTWKTRIWKFTHGKKVEPKDIDLYGNDAQAAYAQVAIASSGGIGVGPGKSVYRDFVAQAYSDFIYAIIIEEMGIIGGAIVLLLYIALMMRIGQIAGRCENTFPAFLAMGLGILLVVQAMSNMLVAVGLAPVTGQPLPFISRGGTATLTNCCYIGAILSVGLWAKKNDSKEISKS